MGAERRMIDAWVATHLQGPDAEQGRADRLAADMLMIRSAMRREKPSPALWRDDAAPFLLR